MSLVRHRHLGRWAQIRLHEPCQAPPSWSLSTIRLHEPCQAPPSWSLSTDSTAWALSGTAILVTEHRFDCMSLVRHRHLGHWAQIQLHEPCQAPPSWSLSTVSTAWALSGTAILVTEQDSTAWALSGTAILVTEHRFDCMSLVRHRHLGHWAQIQLHEPCQAPPSWSLSTDSTAWALSGTAILVTEHSSTAWALSGTAILVTEHRFNCMSLVRHRHLGRWAQIRLHEPCQAPPSWSLSTVRLHEPCQAPPSWSLSTDSTAWALSGTAILVTEHSFDYMSLVRHRHLGRWAQIQLHEPCQAPPSWSLSTDSTAWALSGTAILVAEHIFDCMSLVRHRHLGRWAQIRLQEPCQAPPSWSLVAGRVVTHFILDSGKQVLCHCLPKHLITDVHGQDEMPHKAALHQALHFCWQKQSTSTEIHHL